MFFRQLIDYTSFTYTYLIASNVYKKAILIDPVKQNVNQYIQLLNQFDLKLIASLDTHLHADHITASSDLRLITGCETIMGAQTMAEGVSYKIKDNEIFCVGEIVLKALYTPGHTHDSYSFLVNDRVFTGDTLLIRGTGRTDFQGGDPVLQYESLFHRLLNLNEETLVYPGHDYNGMTVSTIAEEKKFNPRLQVESKNEYIQKMSALNLPEPKLMHIAIPSNLKCGLSEEVL